MADIVIVNARVYTADGVGRVANAVAVKGDKIAYVGGADEARALLPGAKVIDLRGGSVAPGMVDAHQHLLYGARMRFGQISLTGDMTKEDYFAEIRRFVEENPDAENYTGTGFVPEIYTPRKEPLDEISKDKPIVILSYDGHTTWANTAAMASCGITKDTFDPENGVVIRDIGTREPTGFLAGSAGACAGGLLEKLMPAYTREQNKLAILWAQDEMFSAGVTAIFDAHVVPEPDYYMAYEELAREGKLKIRVRGAWFIARETGSERDVSALIDECAEISKSFQTDMFQVGAFKFLSDMVVEAETAYMLKPYRDRNDGWRGVRIWEDTEALARIFAKIDALGFQIHIHQMGDGAAKYSLDALEAARGINGALGKRHTLAHCQYISETDKSRMAGMEMCALTPPYWINTTVYHNFDMPCLGQKRARRQYPVKSLIKRGIEVGVHSDYTVSFPYWCGAMHGLTKRALTPRMFGYLYGHSDGMTYTTDPHAEMRSDVCGPLPLVSERLTFQEALRCMSYSGAYSMFLEEEIGSIEPGRSADMALFDCNIEKDSCCCEPCLTICRGEIVYEKTAE